MSVFSSAHPPGIGRDGNDETLSAAAAVTASAQRLRVPCGLDNNLSYSAGFSFRVYGTQRWGIGDFATYPGSGVTHYTIPIGQYYTGEMQYLFFAMDHDVSGPTGESRFSNVRVRESGG